MGFRRRPRFPALSLPLLIAPLVLGGLAALATELKGNIVVYKIKLPGPSAWAAPSQPSRWVVLDVVDG